MRSTVSCFAIVCAFGAIFFGFSSQADAASLRETLQAAYAYNPDLKAQREALAASDEGVAQAISEWRPTATINLSQGRERSQIGSAPEVFSTTRSRTYTVRQPLFNGFGSVARLKRAEHVVEAGRAELMAQEQETLLDAATAYMNIARDISIVELSKNNESVLGKHLDATNERFDVGEVTRTDVAQGEARRSRAEADRIQAEGNLRSARAEFLRVVGAEPDSVSTDYDSLPLPATLEETIAMAQAGNPQIHVSTHRLEAARKDMRATQSALLPSMYLQGAINREDGSAFFGNRGTENDSVTLNVSVPVYQSGAEHSRVRQAKSILAQREQEMASARDRVREEAIRAWEQWQTARAKMTANEAAIKAAEVALDGVSQEAQYGARTTLDVLDAEQELFDARVGLVRSKRDAAVAEFALAAALGKFTAEALTLEVAEYHPEEHYDDVKYKMLGF